QSLTTPGGCTGRRAGGEVRSDVRPPCGACLRLRGEANDLRRGERGGRGDVPDRVAEAGGDPRGVVAVAAERRREGPGEPSSVGGAAVRAGVHPGGGIALVGDVRSSRRGPDEARRRGGRPSAAGRRAGGLDAERVGMSRQQGRRRGRRVLPRDVLRPVAPSAEAPDERTRDLGTSTDRSADHQIHRQRGGEAGMNSSFVDAMVREADPIDPAHVDAWRRSPAARAIRTRAPGEPVGVVGPRRLRRATAAALAAAILVVLGAGVGAATVLLGKPAPPKVKEDLRGVDAGFPADLRYDPDVADARSVATTGTSTLYYARLKDGGSCTELVTSGVPRGAVCTTLAQTRTEPIQITVPFNDPITVGSPVTIGGHVNVPGATSLEIRYGDGSIDPITIGDEGFFVFEVPSSHLGVVHASRFSIVAADAGGQEVGRADVPAILEEPDGPIQDTAPITVDTISDGSDFTRVLGVRG